MRAGICFDTFEMYPWRADDPPDADAEYEPMETVETIEKALRRLGHEPVRLGNARGLLARMRESTLDVDVAVNIAEGAHTRNREAHVPVLLELAGVPCLGSDALTLSLTLDKAHTKSIVAACGVPTPAWAVVSDPEALDRIQLPNSWPLFVKPRYEGTSKGITPQSRVEDEEELLDAVERITREYRQDALVETFVEGGGEFTVAVVGNDPARALPALQRAVEQETKIGLHALEHRGLELDRELDYELPGELTSELEAKLQDLALTAYEELGCLDFARADFRVDADGAPYFLEINPLPTFAPDDTFAVAAEVMGRDYLDLLAEVLEAAISRVAGE